MSSPEKTLHGLGARFESAAEVLAAARLVRDAGYKHWDVHSPFPIHGIEEAMGLKKSKVSLFALCGGIIGALSAFFMVYFASAIEYPLVVQGKPYFAFEPTFPIYFELTILMTAFATIGSMLALNLLPRYHHPVFNWDLFEKVSTDGFFIVIEARDAAFDHAATAELLRGTGGTDITRIES